MVFYPTTRRVRQRKYNIDINALLRLFFPHEKARKTNRSAHSQKRGIARKPLGADRGFPIYAADHHGSGCNPAVDRGCFETEEAVMDQSDNTKPAAIEVMANGYRKLTVFGVTVKATGTPSLWPAMERLREAINLAAKDAGDE